MRQSIVGEAALSTGAAAKSYEAYKRGYLDTEAMCSQQGITFLPIVAECSGGWGEDSLKSLRHLARVSADRSGRQRSHVLTELLQSLCILIRSAKARAVLRRAPGHQALSAPAAESANVALQLSG